MGRRFGDPSGALDGASQRSSASVGAAVKSTVRAMVSMQQIGGLEVSPLWMTPHQYLLGPFQLADGRPLAWSLWHRAAIPAKTAHDTR
jgi:hypothetical protein